MDTNKCNRLIWPRIVPDSIVDRWYMAGPAYQQAMRDYLMTHTVVFESKAVEDGWQITARMVEKGSGNGTDE